MANSAEGRRKSKALACVLVPSVDPETCVQERLGFSSLACSSGRGKEEAVIRERYAEYMSVPAPKIETMWPGEKYWNTFLVHCRLTTSYMDWVR